jgi:hypothetical protein
MEEQLTFWRRLGLTYYCLRFMDMGSGKKNVMDLTDGDLDTLRQLHDRLGVRPHCLGLPIGKKPMDQWSAELGRVPRAVQIAKVLGCGQFRVFSGYTKRGEDPQAHVDAAAGYLRQMAEMCAADKIFVGLEIEAKLVGRSGPLQLALHQRVNSSNFFLIWDAGNVSAQGGLTTSEVVDQFRLTKSATREIHVKDMPVIEGYPAQEWLDENALPPFALPGTGHSGYLEALRLLAEDLPGMMPEFEQRGLPGYPLTAEPHMDAAGQFAGGTSPEHMESAIGAIRKLCDEAGLAY